VAEESGPAGPQYETEESRGENFGRKGRKCGAPSNGKCTAIRRATTLLE